MKLRIPSEVGLQDARNAVGLRENTAEEEVDRGIGVSSVRDVFYAKNLLLFLSAIFVGSSN